jgi:hypothetical protein
MRFDAQEYIDNWYQKGHYPAIHSAVVGMARSMLIGNRGVDVCCSHGLLGTQLAKNYGFHMLGVDGDAKAIDLALNRGIPMHIHPMKVTRETMSEFFKVAEAHGATFFIMRRCAPELFGDDLPFGRKFFATAAKQGIKEIILEGRVKTSRATNALATLDAEIQLAQDSYRLHTVNGNVAYLQA